MRLTIPVCRDGETTKSGFGEFKEGKMVFTLIAQLLLWIWFLGCTITWRFGKLLLVEGMGIKSAEFVMLCLYSIGLITYYLFQPAGRWILFAILVSNIKAKSLSIILGVG